MKASQILNSALKVLGYSDANGNPKLTGRIRNRAVVTVNLVYADLWHICSKEPFEPIKALDDEIKLPQKATDEVFIYGLAMHIAQSENDGDQQQLYAHLYNTKRTRLSHTATIKNTIPRGED